MIDRRLILIPLVALCALGCSKPPIQALQPGDVLTPEIVIAPYGPWHPGTQVAIGMLVQARRANGDTYTLHDTHVVIEQAVMEGCLTYGNEEGVLGKPYRLVVVHDC